MTTKQAVYDHIMAILELDEEAVDSLKASKVTTLRKLINVKMDSLSLMAENEKDKFIMTDADQIYYFKQWYSTWSANATDPLNMKELITCLTEKEFDNFCNRTKSVEMNQQYLSTMTGPSTSGAGTAANPIVLEEPEAPSIRVSLKDYPTTSGKSTDYPRFRCLFKSVATAGGHAEILAKDYKVPDAVND